MVRKIFYDQIASTYDVLAEESPFYWITRRSEDDFLSKYAPHPITYKRALDLGSGTGFFAIKLAFAGYETIGLDPSKEMTRVAKQKARLAGLSNVDFHCGSIDSLTTQRKFDVVTAFGSVLNHIEHWDRTIKKVSSLLARGGMFLLDYDNLLGLDSISSYLAFGYYNGGIRYAFREFIEGIYSDWKNSPYEGAWTFYVDGTSYTIPLFYRSNRYLRSLLSEHFFEIVEERGINGLTSLVPGIIKSSAVLDCPRTKRVLGKILPKLRRIDNQLGNSRLGRTLAANTILAARKSV